MLTQRRRLRLKAEPTSPPPPRLYTYRYQATGVYTAPDYYCLNVVWSSPPRVGVGVPILPTLPTASQRRRLRAEVTSPPPPATADCAAGASLSLPLPLYLAPPLSLSEPTSLPRPATTVCAAGASPSLPLTLSPSLPLRTNVVASAHLNLVTQHRKVDSRLHGKGNSKLPWGKAGQP